MSCIENLEGDLFCVATNLVMERARRRHVRDRHEQDAYLEQVMPEPEPEHAATAQQALRILSLSIAGMPDRRRLAFERFVFADRTAGQVATEMGVSVKMIEKHVAQARAYCRQMLDAGPCSLPQACSQRCGSRSGQEVPASAANRPRWGPTPNIG